MFGVVGSGNFHVTNALIAGGARFIAARHEGGAAVMADAWARTMGKPGAAGAVGVLSVHQGPGLTNAMTGIAEAAKSRTPLLVLAAEAPEVRSNFHLDVAGLADACGALLATSAVAKGLFGGSPWNLDVSGSFASPLAAELISGADVIAGFGCSLNMWTMRHGKLIGPDATIVQVDDDASAIGAHRPVHLGVLGDVTETARAVHQVLAGGDPDDRMEAPAPVRDKDDGGTPGAAGTPDTAGYRSAQLRDRIAREVRWRDLAYADDSDGRSIDPRTLSIALDDLLPAERTVAVDSGNFMGYPSMYLSVPDEAGFCFTQAFQSIGLGLASAIGAAVARPDRLAVAALGDGGALMGVSELETVVRLKLPMVVVVYDDEAYGAEVHHFGPDGDPLDIVRFPPADIAAIARGFGFEGVTVRQAADLDAVRGWIDGPRERPLLIDAKVTSARGAWWLEEAFRGH